MNTCKIICRTTFEIIFIEKILRKHLGKFQTIKIINEIKMELPLTEEYIYRK